MKLYEEWRLAGLRQHPLLHHRALDVVVLNDDVLFENFDCVKLVGAFAFGQHHLAERALSEDHQEVEIGGTDDVLLAHVVWHVLVGDYRRLLGDGSLAHLHLELGQVGAVVRHGHVVKLTLLSRQQLEPSVAWIFDNFRNAKRERALHGKIALIPIAKKLFFSSSAHHEVVARCSIPVPDLNQNASILIFRLQVADDARERIRVAINNHKQRNKSRRHLQCQRLIPNGIQCRFDRLRFPLDSVGVGN